MKRKTVFVKRQGSVCIGTALRGYHCSRHSKLQLAHTVWYLDLIELMHSTHESSLPGTAVMVCGLWT